MALSLQFEGKVFSASLPQNFVNLPPGPPTLGEQFSAGVIQALASIPIIGKNSAMLNSPVLQSEDLGLLQDFDVKAEAEDMVWRPANRKGVPVVINQHKGFSGSFSIVRQNPVVDLIAQMLQDAYYKGYGQITATMSTVTGDPRGAAYGRMTWVYRGTSLKVTDAGTYGSESAVVYKFEFYCPQRDIGPANGQISKLEAALMTQIAAFNYKDTQDNAF
jgi:hypothetical protein